MKFLNVLKKIILYSAIFFIVVCFSFYLYIENGAKIYFPEKERTELIQQIKSAPQLPENFVNFYSVVYPNNIKYTTWSYLKRQFLSIFPSRDENCLYFQVAKNFCFPQKIYHVKNLFKPIMFSAYIEDYVSQKECLNYQFLKFDFLQNRIGLEAVSQDLFKKPLKNLQPIELAEIIALSENPIRNNRYRNPERTQQRSKALLERYQQKLDENKSNNEPTTSK